MKPTQPDVHALLHRLSECPEVFLEMSVISQGGVVYSEALMNDVLIHMGGDPVRLLSAENRSPLPNPSVNYLKCVQVTCWLLGDSFFAMRPEWIKPVYAWIATDLVPVSQLIPAKDMVMDSDRREELVRRLLRAINVLPAGESAAQAEDRLSSLDSVELRRVLEETERERQRLREVVEAMKKKAAEEAAPTYGRE